MEESAEDLYENAPCGYISTLPDGTIVKVNRTFLSWLGCEREELLGGKRFQDLLTSGGRMFHETHYAPLLRMQGAVNEINFELVGKDGPPVPVLVNTVQKKDADGKPLFYRTTLFNISERKRYERELMLARKKAEEAAKAKADFLSMMSHEIRTPMNAIIGLASVLQSTALSPEQQKYVRILQNSSENLLGLLNNILDFSKIEAGKVALEERRFNLRQLIQVLVQGLGVRAEEKKLSVRVELDERVPTWLVGDPVKLGQVLTNLLGNAIKFTDKGGVTLAVRVREQFSEAVSLDFRVTDTGIGIAPELLPRVFEEFSQASDDVTLKYGGTGLGLSICQRLLELHGSRMDVESAPGVGSTFAFNLRLKMSRDAEESDGSVSSLLKSQSLRGVRILVAEDNDINVFVLSQFLRAWGIHFDVVGNGRLAVEKVQEADYDLVLMDLQMPVMDGHRAMLAIRNLPEERLRQLPIVALTASTRSGDAEWMNSSGFTDFLGKPFNPEELFGKIAMHGLRQPVAPSVPPPAPAVPEGEREERASCLPPPRFSLEKFRSLAEGDAEALIELSTLAIHNAEAYKHDVQRAIETGNREEFEFHAHRMKMTLELLQAHELWAALNQGRQLLEAPERDSVRIPRAVDAIHGALDVLIGALKEEVQRASLSAVEGPPSRLPLQ